MMSKKSIMGWGTLSGEMCQILREYFNESLRITADITEESKVSLKLTARELRGTGRDGGLCYLPTEQFNLYPIGCDKSAVAKREKTAEIRTPPEVVSSKTTSGELCGNCELRATP